MATWTTGLAYLAATLFYQIATFAQHPASSTAWILGSIGFAAIVIGIMRAIGQRATAARPAPAAARA